MYRENHMTGLHERAKTLADRCVDNGNHRILRAAIATKAIRDRSV